MDNFKNLEQKHLVFIVMGIVVLGVIVGGSLGWAFSDRDEAADSADSNTTVRVDSNTQNSNSAMEESADDNDTDSMDTDSEADEEDTSNTNDSDNNDEPTSQEQEPVDLGLEGEDIITIEQTLDSRLTDHTSDMLFQVPDTDSLNYVYEQMNFDISDDDYSLRVTIISDDFPVQFEGFEIIGEDYYGNEVARVEKVNNATGETEYYYTRPDSITTEGECAFEGVVAPCGGSTLSLNSSSGLRFTCEAENQDGIDKCDYIVLNAQHINPEADNYLGEYDGDAVYRPATLVNPSADLEYDLEFTLPFGHSMVPSPENTVLRIFDDSYEMGLVIPMDDFPTTKDDYEIIGENYYGNEYARIETTNSETSEPIYKYIRADRLVTEGSCPAFDSEIDAPCGPNTLSLNDEALLDFQCTAENQEGVEICDFLMLNARISGD